MSLSDDEKNFVWFVVHADEFDHNRLFSYSAVEKTDDAASNVIEVDVTRLLKEHRVKLTPAVLSAIEKSLWEDRHYPQEVGVAASGAKIILWVIQIPKADRKRVSSYPPVECVTCGGTFPGSWHHCSRRSGERDCVMCGGTFRGPCHCCAPTR